MLPDGLATNHRYLHFKVKIKEKATSQCRGAAASALGSPFQPSVWKAHTCILRRPEHASGKQQPHGRAVDAAGLLTPKACPGSYLLHLESQFRCSYASIGKSQFVKIHDRFFPSIWFNRGNFISLKKKTPKPPHQMCYTLFREFGKCTHNILPELPCPGRSIY